ncbi:unnamed protein product [Rhodiola kirilowii]
MDTTTYNDGFSHLLCGEDSSEVLLSADSTDYASSELELAADVDGSAISNLIENESKFVPGLDYAAKFKSMSLDELAREESVAWILKVHNYYGFQPLTAYLAVNYLDRFLYSRRLPETTGWPMQLLSVACLSLAAKMEESLVPTLHQLQVKGAKFIFEAKTIRRMELLVLSVLDWKLRSITPFDFVEYFAEKLDSSGVYKVFLVSRATEIILSNIREISFVEYLPSCIAAAGVLCAGNEFPISSFINPELVETWCDGLNKESINGCYQLLQESGLVVKSERKRALRAVPHLRVTTTTSRASLRPCDDSSSSSSSSSSSPFFKRRRLNGTLWVVNDENGGSG